MLNLFRRHLKRCPHRAKGRKHRACACPLMVEGTLRGQMVRKSLDIRSWEAGQQTIREWEIGGVVSELTTLSDASDAFLKDAVARNVRLSTVKNLRVILDDLKRFADRTGRRTLREFDLEALREFREAWRFAPITAAKKIERLRSFFRFAKDSGWVDENPCEKLKSPHVKLAPTLPFTNGEFDRIIAACDLLPDNYGRAGGPNGRRMKALVLLLRYSGLRIGDAVSLARTKLQGDKLFLYTQKTGAPVLVPLPESVVAALGACTNKNPDHYFWTGKSTLHSATSKWRTRFAKLLALAGVENGHFHRLRDTFAVSLLERGVPLDQVAILLGHSSIKITEKHYAPWVKSRQMALDEAVRRAWSAEDGVAKVVRMRA